MGNSQAITIEERLNEIFEIENLKREKRINDLSAFAKFIEFVIKNIHFLMILGFGVWIYFNSIKNLKRIYLLLKFKLFRKIVFIKIKIKQFKTKFK